MKPRRIIALVVLAVAIFIVYTQFTIFVIQPIGAIPEGRTILTWRRERTRFIDSADGVCQRETGGVNLLCRAAVLGGIAGQDGSGILLRLPYSETLYLISTGGMQFSN